MPVVATDVGGNAELVSAGRTGCLVPVNDVEGLALALLGLANDPGEARRLGQAGRLEVERRFSMGAMVDAYRGLYDRHLLAAGHEEPNS